MEYNGISIEWDGHASLRFIDEDFTVAVDPYSEVSPEFEADIVLVTHGDVGHFDPEKLEEICTDRTCLVMPESMKDRDVPCHDVEYIEEGEIIDVYGVKVEGVPMYNEDHPRGEGLGYRIVMVSNAFYVAGDTGPIDEIIDLENRVDIAFLPVEGTFTMDFDEAVRSAVRIKPARVVPYHFGKPFFEELNIKPFRTMLEDRNIDCTVLEQD